MFKTYRWAIGGFPITAAHALLSATGRAECARQRGGIGEAPKLFVQLPVDETEFLAWQEYCEKQGDEHPELCPQCGKRQVYLVGRKDGHTRKEKGVHPRKWPLPHGHTVCYDGIIG